MPERLGALLDEWKATLRRIEDTPTWDTHFELMAENGLPRDTVNAFCCTPDAFVTKMQIAFDKAAELQGYTFNRDRGSSGRGGNGGRHGRGRYRGGRVNRG